MDEPLKKSATLAERRKTAKIGRTPVKLRARPGRRAPSEAAGAGRVSLPPEAKSLMPSAALIGVGLLLESELLVGIAIGSAVVIASRWLPGTAGDTLRPAVENTVNACYSAAAKTSEMLGDALQRVESIITRQAPGEKESAPATKSNLRARGDQPQA